ncbi:MAG: hypothetical protein GY815_14640 [Gammaproteobacteria bacterium]|nr:hypothetical protein [Gammaproteobacteria bacterium]
MVNLDLCYTPATELLRRYHAGDISPVEVVQNPLARIDEVNPTLNCFCFTCPEEALATAKAAEQRLGSGKARQLEGIPLAIKDFTPTRGKLTTRVSRLFEDWVPDHGYYCATGGNARLGFRRLNEQGLSKFMDMTSPFNYMAQCPALSVPSGFVDDLPTATQIVAHRRRNRKRYALVASTSRYIEEEFPW